MMINIITIYAEGKDIYNCGAKNDYYNHKGTQGGGQRVMIEIIISETIMMDDPILYDTCCEKITSVFPTF